MEEEVAVKVVGVSLDGGRVEGADHGRSVGVPVKRYRNEGAVFSQTLLVWMLDSAILDFFLGINSRIEAQKNPQKNQIRIHFRFTIPHFGAWQNEPIPYFEESTQH